MGETSKSKGPKLVSKCIIGRGSGFIIRTSSPMYLGGRLSPFLPNPVGQLVAKVRTPLQIKPGAVRKQLLASVGTTLHFVRNKPC